MQAIQISRFGGPEVLELREVPTPVPGPSQLLVRVRSAGVNFADTLMREGRYVASYTLPATPGSEIAGEIAWVGGDVEGFAVGDRVVAVLAAAKMLTGGYAEYAVADAAVTVPIPDAVDFDAAVSVAVQGLTALHLTREVPPTDEAVMITAGGGGVASLLIQLSLLAGARQVIAVASSDRKRAHALTLGATKAIAYDEIEGEEPTLIYESVGGAAFEKCLSALAFKGTLVAYGALNLTDVTFGAHEWQKLVFGNQNLRGFSFGPLLARSDMQRELVELLALLANGKIRAPIGAAFPLSQAQAAHQSIMERASIGKLVLRP